jgi:hypothetical protein
LVKTCWENQLNQEVGSLRYHGHRVTQLSAQLSQDALVGVLGGFRAIVADLVWLTDVTGGFQNEKWHQVKQGVDIVTTLQPRFVPYWDLGGWHLAWNASTDARHDRKETDELRRLKNERVWIDLGEDVLIRGADANPASYKLYQTLAMLRQQRLKDYPKAAEYYAESSRRPDSPFYLERFPAYMWERAGNDQRAYDHWKMLWLKHLGSPPTPEKALDKIEAEIRVYEDRLNIPIADRVFPYPQKPEPNSQAEYSRLIGLYQQAKDLPPSQWPIPPNNLKKELEKLEIRLGIPKEKRVFSGEKQ